MKPTLLVLAIAALSLLPSAAMADVHVHHSAHVQFWIPDNWRVSGDEAGQLRAADPSNQVALVFQVGNHKDMKGAVAGIATMLGAVATDVQVGRVQDATINGMATSVVDAKGHAEGHPVELSVMIVRTPNGHFLWIMGIEDAAHKHDHDAELQKILASIAPAR